jgi:hypothetical protein
VLSSIHPFGERARGQRYWITVVSYILGAATGGATLGTILGLVAWAMSFIGLGGVMPATAALAVAALWDLSPLPVPTLRRQVDENWLPRYREWVYGVGFGAQLGFGLVTFVTTPLTYGFVAAAVLSGNPLVGLGAGAIFGVVRGLTVLVTAPISTPERLRGLFRAVNTARTPARLGTAAAVLLVVIATL